MRVWHGYGTEHSMNLKMIGHFSDGNTASEAATAIEVLAAATEKEREAGRLEVGEPPELLSSELLEVLTETGIHSLARSEFEQFLYDVHVKAEGSDVIVHTDEIDVMAYIKALIARGAKVELYSQHDFKEGTGES